MITESDVLSVLTYHIGSTHGITCRRLVCSLNGGESSACLERQVRQVIMNLRLQGEHVCGHPSTGYFIAETPAELDATCLFLYERAMTSLKQVAAMKRVSLPDLAGQLRLPS